MARSAPSLTACQRLATAWRSSWRRTWGCAQASYGRCTWKAWVVAAASPRQHNLVASHGADPRQHAAQRCQRRDTVRLRTRPNAGEERRGVPKVEFKLSGLVLDVLDHLRD